MKIKSPYKDQNGNDIFLYDKVKFENQEYDVIINPFNNEFCIDNDCGQTWLKDVHHKCVITQSN